MRSACFAGAVAVRTKHRLSEYQKSSVKRTPWVFNADAGDDVNDGSVLVRADAPPIQLPLRVHVRRMSRSTARRKGVQAVKKSPEEVCFLASWPLTAMNAVSAWRCSRCTMPPDRTEWSEPRHAMKRHSRDTLRNMTRENIKNARRMHSSPDPGRDRPPIIIIFIGKWSEQSRR